MGHYSSRLCDVFFLGLPNLKMISTTLNTSFQIDLGRFVGD
jgi:hypothetical protein